MIAMMLKRPVMLDRSPTPLERVEMPLPRIGPGDILIRVKACGVCHTELDEIEGRLPVQLPVIPGHQVVGQVIETGSQVKNHKVGDRVGVAWIFHSCGHCEFCLKGAENLCPEFRATGKDAHGGYAQYMKVPHDFTYPLPEALNDAQAAPLLCAGAIGYRSLRLAGLSNGQNLGLTGFGASAHLVLQLVRQTFPETPVYVFARNEKKREFARALGAVWAGDTHETPPDNLHAIIDTTPAWTPVIEALAHLVPGGRLVINAIRKETNDISVLQSLDYARDLWQEKEIKSVANVTRQDVRGFLGLADLLSISPEVRLFPLASANEALMELKYGKIRGAKVLVMDE